MGCRQGRDEVLSIFPCYVYTIKKCRPVKEDFLGEMVLKTQLTLYQNFRAFYF